VSGTALPGQPGHCAIAGHRDTWAAFLDNLRPGETLLLRTRRGVRRYRISSLRVASQEKIDVLEPTLGDRLTLITCYPFSGILRSPWRFLVTCAPAGPIMLQPASAEF
jgi:sortase A